MLPMMFALDPGSQNLRYLTEDVAEYLRRHTHDQRGPHVYLPDLGQRTDDSGPVNIKQIAEDDTNFALDDIRDGQRIKTIGELAAYLDVLLLESNYGEKTRQAFGTLSAFVRRFKGACGQLAGLVRGDLPQKEIARGHLDPLQSSDMVHVIDIHELPSAAQAFVVGVTLKGVFGSREGQNTQRGRVFILLDELNKYAPADGDSPIKDTLLDIAERGRSLGVILIGAQQTASEVERRIVGNAAIRVVGRLDMAEASRPEYKFLPSTMQARSGILSPGSMIVHQPDVPAPLLVTFPYPAWATREDEVLEAEQELEAFVNIAKP